MEKIISFTIGKYKALEKRLEEKDAEVRFLTSQLKKFYLA